MSKDKLLLIARGAALAALGAAVPAVAQYIGTVDLGAAGPIVGAAITILLDAFHHWMTPAAPPMSGDATDTND